MAACVEYAALLLRRYALAGDLADVEAAMGAGEMAVSRAGDNPRARAVALNVLANARAAAFQVGTAMPVGPGGTQATSTDSTGAGVVVVTVGGVVDVVRVGGGHLVDVALTTKGAAALGVEITDAELQAHIDELVRIELRGDADAWRRFLDQRGYPEGEIRAQLREDRRREAVEDRLVPHPVVPAERVDQAYRNQYAGRPIIRHILVAEEPQARQVLERLAAGEDFAKLAVELSLDTLSACRGGDLGPHVEDAFVAPFEEAIENARDGQTVGPVQTPFGYHIIQRRLPATLPQVRGDIETTLAEQLRTRPSPSGSRACVKRQTSMSIPTSATGTPAAGRCCHDRAAEQARPAARDRRAGRDRRGRALPGQRRDRYHPVTPGGHRQSRERVRRRGRAPLGERLLALVVANGTPAPSAARLFSQLGMVLHAASAAGTPDFRPFAGRVAGALGSWNPPPLKGDLHWPLVANAALLHLVPRLYPDLSGPVMRQQLIAAQRFTSDAQPTPRTRSADAGRTLGQALMDWELRVMQADRIQLTPVPTAGPPGPGSWLPTPLEYELPALPQWGHVRTLVLARGSDVDPGPPTPYSEDPSSPCRAGAQEVVDVVAGLSPVQLAVTRHWADGEWSITPPGHWLGIVTAALRDRSAAFDETAETYLRLALSQHDAFVSCWWAKYHYNVLRSITYARRVLGRPGWLSPIKTPPFPEYPSVQSAAAAEVLTAQFGATAFTDRMTESRGLPPRQFTDFRAAAQEAGISRLYGGIHFRPAIERGIDQGVRIGQAVAKLPLRG